MFSISVTSPAQFLVYINFQVGLGNQIQRNTHLPVSSILKEHVVAVDSQQAAPEIALSVNRLALFHLRLAARETFEVSSFVQAPLQSRRRYFEGVGSMNEVFHIQNRPQVNAHF